MSLLTPPNIHGQCILPIAPPINILNALPMDHTSISAILWDILTRKMPPIPVPHDDHHSHLLIKSTTSTNHIHNTYIPPIHTPSTYHSSSRLAVHTNPPYHKTNTEPVTIPARVNTIMTNPCTLPCSRNYLFEPSAQNFADHPVHCTPVIINAANDNLPVHFINHSDRDVVVPKHTYVRVMGKIQESDPDNLSTNVTTPETVS